MLTDKIKRKRCVMWTEAAVNKLIDIWEIKANDLRKMKRNSHIYEEIAGILRANNVKVNRMEVHIKIANLTQRYRHEKKAMEHTGESKSEWKYFPRIHNLHVILKSENYNETAATTITTTTTTRTTTTTAAAAAAINPPSSPSSSSAASHQHFGRQTNFSKINNYLNSSMECNENVITTSTASRSPALRSSISRAPAISPDQKMRNLYERNIEAINLSASINKSASLGHTEVIEENPWANVVHRRPARQFINSNENRNFNKTATQQSARPMTSPVSSPSILNSKNLLKKKQSKRKNFYALIYREIKKSNKIALKELKLRKMYMKKSFASDEKITNLLNDLIREVKRK